MGEAQQGSNFSAATGQSLDDLIKRRLAEKGLTVDDVASVVEGAPGINAEGGRWRICPGCKANIDMMTIVKGRLDGVEWPRILPTGAVECPNCGCYGERFGLNAMNEAHPKLPTYQAQAVSRQFPWAAKHVREALSLIEDLGLFPSDPMFNASEPHWPRDLGACILGGAMMLVATIQRQGDRLDVGKRASRKRDRKKWRHNVPWRGADVSAAEPDGNR